MIEIYHVLIKKIKSFIYKKNAAFKKCCWDWNNSFRKRRLSILPDRLITSIEASEIKYYCRITNKLINTQKKLKSLLVIAERFFEYQKIHLIPPLFHGNRFITNFDEKAEYFNFLFAKQCSLIKNDSKLPTCLMFYIDNHLSTVRFSHQDVGKNIQNLNPNKAHGHDNTTIRMLNICNSTICKPLEINFKKGFKYCFVSIRKKETSFLSIKKVLSKS